MSEFELRRALRGLDTGRNPGRDLWPGIAARLQRVEPASAPPRRRPATRWPLLMALAASLVLAVVLALPMLPMSPSGVVPGDGSRAVPAPVAAAPAAPADATTPVARGGTNSPLQLQADALTIEYAAALGQLGTRQAPPALAPSLRELDSSAQTIREAMRQDPQAEFLLGQLQRTYARRLRLTQLAVTG